MYCIVKVEELDAVVKTLPGQRTERIVALIITALITALGILYARSADGDAYGYGVACVSFWFLMSIYRDRVPHDPARILYQPGGSLLPGGDPTNPQTPVSANGNTKSIPHPI